MMSSRSFSRPSGLGLGGGGGGARAVGARSARVVCVATPSKPPASTAPRRSKVEEIKENSDFLRHPLMEELKSTEPFINEPAMQLMKFHGSYMQDHREKRAFGQGKFYQFMMRTRQPAGKVSNQLYLTMDDLANEYGNGTLRLTTRQTYQLHGVLKQDLKTVFSTVIKNMGSTLGACGDVNRNVCGPPAPYTNRPEYAHCEKLCHDLADLLAPQAGSYYDVWLDGEKFMSLERENPEVTKARADNSHGTNYVGSPEPIYGSLFLPRKFKIACTVPGDNSVDIFTNDIAIVCMHDDAGEVYGYNIYVGGGMGRSHRNNATFPRVATALGFVPKEDIFYAVKAIVCTQRDYGRRDDRKQARLKYLINDWGIDKFRAVTEQYYGKKFKTMEEEPAWEWLDYLGWGEQEPNGLLYWGINVENGRLRGGLKKALRQVIEDFNLTVRLTANQSIILCDIQPKDKAAIEAVLSDLGGYREEDVDPIVSGSMACPAMPLCGLAIGEAERGLPDVNLRLRAMLNKVGAGDAAPIVRMTGCPNGCARPYMAEIGFVCDGPNTYQIWLGGNREQTRLAEVYAERVKISELEASLEPLFFVYQSKRLGPEEGFGDFCNRLGFPVLQAYAKAYTESPIAEAAAEAAPAAAVSGKLPRVMVDADAFAALKELASRRGVTLTQAASDAIVAASKQK
ncbi:hypothetical protein PPROV_000235800 [Pycnococcus provasolii]|uniref:assimilatory sulfite reductase (ferredoxin) n=2 Tax=Pycnococcus provasolii TaxID=41880 RepID=A0A830HAW3_9CHLO|nr:hypothetical protein PPROV_000235800 [Pycnococcus provasolii]|mmetsp:Transcript_9362/g.25171  ORF Transcript_9362/g.25171 Transcript_9362/m.25171 type:complete len:681 (-) Transcript_9362:135-2177(-)